MLQVGTIELVDQGFQFATLVRDSLWSGVNRLKVIAFIGRGQLLNYIHMHAMRNQVGIFFQLGLISIV